MEAAIRSARLYLRMLFEPYRPQDHGRALEGVVVRTMTADDLPAVAALAAEREGLDEADQLARIRGELERIEQGELKRHISVADVNGVVAGFARVSHFDAEGTDDARNAPSGWYLGGVIVAPDRRRGGLGRALTRQRIEWVRAIADRVYYFASARNPVSLALHDEFDFIEITRDFECPGVTFTGGVGVLFELRLSE